MRKSVCFLAIALMLVLNMNAQTLKGDVNKDGEVDVSDVTALVDIILSGTRTPEEANDTLAVLIDGLMKRVRANEEMIDTLKMNIDKETIDRMAADSDLEMLIYTNKSHIKKLEEEMQQILRKLVEERIVVDDSGKESNEK